MIAETGDDCRDTRVYAWAALRCLTSPASALSAILLLLNDHALKALWPSWITGKLSDFAGLYFTSYLLLFFAFAMLGLAQRIARATGTRGGIGTLSRSVVEAIAINTFLVVGVGFGAIKLSPLSAAPVLGLLSRLAGQELLAVADVSDLLALGVLPIAYAGWRQQAANAGIAGEGRAAARLHRTFRGRGFACLPLLAIATMAVVATSPAAQPAVSSIAVDSGNSKVMLISIVPYWPGPPGASTRASGESTLYQSEDGGSSWRRVAAGGERVIADPAQANVFYVVRANSLLRFQTGRAELQAVWPPSGGTAPGTAAGQGIAAELPGWRPNLIFVGTIGAVARSYDGGASWTSVSVPGATGKAVTSLASAPSRPGLLFAAADGKVVRSEDWGDSWTSAGATAVALSTLAVHPKNADLLVGGAKGTLVQSADGGRTWRTTWTGGDSETAAVSAILLESGQQAYAAVPWFGLLESGDGGASWHQRLRGDVRGVTVANQWDGQVFLAAGYQGVYRERGVVRWPWMWEWEYANDGIPFGPTGFVDRLVNVFSWLLVLALLIVAARLAAPAGARRFLTGNVWEIALAIWTVVPSVFVIAALWQGSSSAAAESIFAGSLPMIGVIGILAKARLSWPTWSMVVMLQGVIVAAFLLQVDLTGFDLLGKGLVASAIALLAVGLVYSAQYLRNGRPRGGKIALTLVLVGGNVVQWALALIALGTGVR